MKIRRMKKIFNLFILFGLIFGICSCGEQNTGGDNPTPPIVKPTEPIVDDHQHSFKVGYEREATCVEPGFIEYVCDCGETYSEDFPMLDHNFTEWEILNPATKEDPIGFEYRVCENCEYTEEREYTFVCEHLYEDTVIEPTCTKSGYTISKCVYCNDEYTKDNIESLGHNYLEDVVEPSCIEGGYTLHKCSRCNDSYKDNYTNKLSHNMISYEYKEPTCIETGNIEGFYCDLCELYYIGNNSNYYNVESLIISPSGHNYTTETIKPTCDKQGYDIHVCILCEDTYIDNYVAISGHSYNELYYDLTNHWKKCSCGSFEEKVEHTFENNVCSVCKIFDINKISFVKAKENGEDCIAFSVSAQNDAIIYLPDTYEGLPVRIIRSVRGGKTLVIPSNITTIEKDAFEYAEFYNVDFLGTIEQYLNIKYNGYYTYLLCQARFLYFNGVELTGDLVIPEGITELPDYAFANTNISSVTLPSSLESIGFRAFYYCDRLSKINIPDDNSLKHIAEEAFYSISGEAFNHLDDASYLSTPNNDKFILYKIAYDNKNTTSFEVDSNTKFIYNRAFEFCEQLETVTLPDTLIEIGEGAFWYCTSLKNVNLPDGLTKISKETFYNNQALNNIKIPSTVTFIGESAFLNCSSLTSIHIPGSVKEIESFVFVACYNLTEITIDEGLEIIRQNALSSMGVKELILPKSLKVIEYNIIGDSVLEKLSIPYLKREEYETNFCGLADILGGYIPSSLKELIISTGESIDARYFENCLGIETIYLPDNLKEFINEEYYNIAFNSNVFNAYENNMYIGSLNNPYLLLFDLEDNQTEIVLHKDFKVTSNTMFINENIDKVYYEGTLDTWLDVSFTTKLSTPMYTAKEFYILNDSNTYEEVTTLKFDDSITSINQYQFFGFINVKDVYLSKNINEFGLYAFGNLSNVNVYYDGTIEDWLNISFKGEDANPGNFNGHLYQLKNNEYVETTKLIIPEGTSTIGMYQFDGFRYIEELTMPSSVKEIKENAFTLISSNKTYYNGNINDYLEIDFSNQFSTFASGAFYLLEDSNYIELTSLVIPDNIETIKQYAFEGINSIVEIYLPLSVNRISEGAFLNSNNIDDVYFHGNIDDWCNISLKYQYSTPMHNTANFYIYNGTEYELLTDLIIPSNVTEISNYQFYGFDVEEITIPFIGSDPNTKYNNYFGYIFGAHSYSEQRNRISSKLKTINIINESLTSIPANAFYGLNNVEYITIPKNVSVFGTDAFKNCSSLKEINYLGDINNWCKSTFNSNYSNPLYYASKLYINGKVIEGDIILDEGITTIPYATFRNSNIASISIPSTINKIEGNAFYNCVLLEKVNIGITVNDWCKLEFGNSNSNPMLYADYMYINDELIAGDIILDDDITTIPFATFKNSLITSIDLSDNLSWIEAEAFDNCELLNIVKYKDFYSWCKDIIFESNPMEYSQYIYFDNKILEGNIVMDEQITTIPFGTFKNSKIEKLSLQFIGASKYDYENNYIGYIFGASSYNLTSLVFPSTLKELEILQAEELNQYSLYGTEGLEALTLPYIGNDSNPFFAYAFGASNYEQYQLIPTSLKTVNIIGSQTVSDYAFNNCGSIETINFKDIYSIGQNAFNNCIALKQVTISSGLTSIGVDAFNGCDALERINYEGDIYNWCNISFGNALSNPMYKAEYLLMHDEILSGDVDLYNKVSHIPYGTFKNSNIESLVVETIEDGLDYLFGDVMCETLTSITIYDTVINEKAFNGYNSISKIVFMEEVTSFGYDSFTGCTPNEVYYAHGSESFLNAEFNESKYTTLNKITSSPMNGGAHFYYLSNNEWVELTNLVVNDGITEIDRLIVGGFRYIKNITIPSSVKTITYSDNEIEIVNYLGTLEEWFAININNIMHNASYLYINNEILAGDYVIDFEATSIPYGTFKNSNIESIVLPSSVKVVYENAFLNCSLLESITFSSSIIFDETSFTNTDIKNVYFGGSIKDWCSMEFESSSQSPMCNGADFYMLDDSDEWYKVIDLVITNDIQRIYAYSFYGCESIESVTISNSVKGILKDTFYNCINLENVYYAGSVSDYASMNYANETAHPMYYASNFYSLDENGDYYKPTEIVINNDVTRIGSYAFYNFKQLTKITLGDNIEEISNNCFDNCDNLTYSKYDNLYYIESSSNPYFYLVDVKPNSQQITLNKGVKFIEENAFRDVVIEDVYFKGTLTDYLNINFVSITSNPCNNGSNLYLLNNGNYELLTKLVIPDSYKVINQYQFYGVISLTELIMPNTITEINSEAFAKCTNLETIVLSSLIRDLDTCSVFKSCNNIKGVYSYATDIYKFLDTVEYIVLSPIYNKTVYFYREDKPEIFGGYSYWYLEDSTIKVWTNE